MDVIRDTLHRRPRTAGSSEVLRFRLVGAGRLGRPVVEEQIFESKEAPHQERDDERSGLSPFELRDASLHAVLSPQERGVEGGATPSPWHSQQE